MPVHIRLRVLSKRIIEVYNTMSHNDENTATEEMEILVLYKKPFELTVNIRK